MLCNFIITSILLQLAHCVDFFDIRKMFNVIDISSDRISIFDMQNVFSVYQSNMPFEYRSRAPEEAFCFLLSSIKWHWVLTTFNPIDHYTIINVLGNPVRQFTELTINVTLQN